MPITPRRIPALRETSPEVYRELGLKSGLEIHQQLLTERKLFCRCPARPYREDYDAELLRHMRPTLSEMGEYDGTALMEKKTKKEIVYQITGDTTCTYEMDDSPPFLINQQAVDIGIEMALLLKTNIVGELHIARKQYLDGSIPTGFQRTAIVGLAGRIPLGDRTIGITQLSVEEDACREIADRGHLRVYRTDRLSRPLIETVTDPDMRTPDEVAAACRRLARLARGTGKMRTGIGAGRQDVNVSVAGGTRVEIKGVHRIPRIPALVHYEAFRQRALLDIRDRLQEKGLSPDGYRVRAHEPPAAAQALDVAMLRHHLATGGVVRVVVLPGFREILPWPVGPTRVFADELACQIRVVACLDVMPNLLREGDGLTPASFWATAREETKAGEDDAVALVAGPARDVATAVGELEDRCRQAMKGVPNETRQVLSNGETRFERVLPGPERMYPDTDLPPLAIPDERLARIRAGLLPPVWEREQWLAELGVPPHEIVPLAISRRYPVFAQVVRELGVAPKDASRVLVSTLKALEREGRNVNAVPDAEVTELFALFTRKAFAREAFGAVLRHMTDGVAAVEAIRRAAGEPVTAAGVRARAKEVVRAAPAIADPGRRSRYLMGLAMAGLRGRVPGREMLAAIEEEVKR